MYPVQLYFDIASQQGQDMRNHAAHERFLREAARPEPKKPSDRARDAGYRRLAVAILGLDVNTLTGALRTGADR
jgi:hypothetical protein